MSSQSEFLYHPSHPHPLHRMNIHNSGLRHDCNACWQQISGFSRRCEGCNFDLHITCASMPLSLTHQSHHHKLFLIFSPPYYSKQFTCNICRMVGNNHWLYRCECGFDAHLGCIHTPNIQQTHLPSYPSTPTANPRYQAAVGTQQFPTGPTPRPQPRPPSINYNYPAGAPNNYVNHGHGYVRPSGLQGSGRRNNNVMNQAIQGLINGTAQTLGAYGVQAALGVGAFAGTGGGSNDYGANGGGGGGDWGGDGGPSNDYGGNDASSF